MTTAVRRLYSACAGSYARYHKGTGCMHMPIFREGDADITDCLGNSHGLLLHSLGLPRGAQVLDVGCGVGAFSVEAADRLNLRVTGIALTQPEIAAANARAVREGKKEDCCFLVHDMNNLSALGASRFEAVVNLETDCYFRSPEHAVREVASVLVDGGTWHTMRFSVHSNASHNASALRLAARIAHCWHTAKWVTDRSFETAALSAFEPLRNEDLSGSVLAFWTNLMPIRLDRVFAVRVRFALRALSESAHLLDFPIVYQHRIAFWLLMLGLSRGWLEYRYRVFKKKEVNEQ